MYQTTYITDGYVLDTTPHLSCSAHPEKDIVANLSDTTCPEADCFIRKLKTCTGEIPTHLLSSSKEALVF